MTLFTEVQPTLENYWRSIILFGRNVASYKFALGKSLLDIAQQGSETGRWILANVTVKLKNPSLSKLRP